MRLLTRLSLLSLPFLVAAQDAEGTAKQSFGYQSDVARLRKIVINSLYSHRDVFLRELISNANDALEKLRITSLTDKLSEEQPLNITIKAIPNADGPGGRLVLTDYGIGMSAEDLAANLGTVAKSGTSDFLTKAEGGDASNLIGQFGVGFYSSFLVADQVYVASIPRPSKENPEPTQNVFSSNAEDSSFDVYPDPRGNTLGRGTEITLVLKDDALEYLGGDRLRELVQIHSAFSTNFPIYLHEIRTEEVIDEEAAAILEAEEAAKKAAEETAKPADEEVEETTPVDDDEEAAIVEELSESEEVMTDASVPIPMKNVTSEVWAHLNDVQPLWQRPAKDVSTEEYNEFYRQTYKDSNNPIGMHHFKGDAGAISFKAMLFIPPVLDRDYWTTASPIAHSIRLLVKRVFITSDFGDNGLPKWISWLKAIVDADDLPLNVSRETLQSTRFLKQVKQVLINKAIALLARISEEDPEKYKKVIEVYGAALKLGAVESAKERQKIVGLTRWSTNLRNFTSLDQIVGDKKKGQNHIFYLAQAGSTPELLAKSVFIEKLNARGYEVLLCTEPMDEILIQNLRQWKGMAFQDVSKKGLEFGDEDAEAEKAELEELKTKFEPLMTYMKEFAKESVRDVMITTRLVQSACAIVADQFGYSANMERLMQAQNQGKPNKDGQQYMHEWARKQRALEINPRSPLIEGLLRKIVRLTDIEEGEEKDPELEKEVQEIAGILVDSALVRSGFDVTDSNEFFERIDRVLRRAVGVAEDAPTDTTVAPGPEAANEEPATDEMTKRLAAELDYDVVVDEEHFDDGPVDLPKGFKLGKDGIPEVNVGDLTGDIPVDAEIPMEDAEIPIHDELAEPPKWNHFLSTNFHKSRQGWPILGPTREWNKILQSPWDRQTKLANFTEKTNSAATDMSNDNSSGEEAEIYRKSDKAMR